MGKNLSKLFCVFAFSLFFLISSSAIAVERHVPSQYPTIQAAIDASANGDEVVLADGTYIGTGNRNIHFWGKTITLRSENGPTHCIIDCQAETPCVVLIESGAPVIEGFTIVRCSTIGSSPAINLWGVSCIIRNCIFIENAACIYCTPGPDTKVVNCTFYRNTADVKGGAVGISTNIHNGGVFTVSNNIFWDNEPNDIDYDFHMCKSGFHPGTYVVYSMLQSNWKNQIRLFFENCIYGQDPCFVNTGDNDFHLKSQKGRWDPNSKTWVKDTVTSPGIDLGDPASGYCEESWPHGKRINAGSYGGTPEASLSVVHKGNVADITCDEQVAAPDFSAFSGEWQVLDQPRREDFNHNGTVDMGDILIFASNWLKVNIDAVLLLDKTTYLPGEPIVASFSNMPGNQFDWLGLCAKGASIEPYAGVIIDWYYTDGTQISTPGITEGFVTFTSVLEPGDYEVRLFFDNGYDIQDRKFLKVQ